MVTASIALLILLASLSVVGVALWKRGTTPLGPAPAPSMAALAVPDTAATRELLGRWRDRARRWRTVAAYPAVLFATVSSIRLTGEVRFGLVDTVGRVPLWADPLVVGLLTIALGGFAAELHHLRRSEEGPRTADLRPRDVATLRRAGSRRRRITLGVVVLVAVGVHVAVVLPGDASGSPAALLLAAAVLGAAEIVERRIALRPRPALDRDLAVADDAVRRAAVRSVDDAASGAALLLVGWASLGTVDAAPPGRLVDAAAVAASLTVLGLSLWWAWRSAPRRLLAGGARRDADVPA